MAFRALALQTSGLLQRRFLVEFTILFLILLSQLRRRLRNWHLLFPGRLWLMINCRLKGKATRSGQTETKIKHHAGRPVFYKEGRTHHTLTTEEHFWWKNDLEALCFDLQLTPESELTIGAPPASSLKQWWDVEKLGESDHFVAVTKPAGFYVLTDGQGLWNKSPTNLVHAANKRFELPCSDEPRQRGICHRLDSYTSGVQIFGKTWDAYQHFRIQNTLHRMQKEYIALVDGRLGHPDYPNTGVIDVPMKKWQDFSRYEFGSIVCTRDGEPAVTKYKVLRQFRVPAKGDLKFWGRDRWFTLVQLRILTGRTHQIRVHMAFIGHPLIGDDKYSPACYEDDYAITPRIFLHCLRMDFEDMDTSMFKASSELPPDLQVVLHRLHNLSDSAPEVQSEPSQNIAYNHFSFPGFAWLLEQTQAAAPQSDVESSIRQPQRMGLPCLYCKQMEVASCKMVRRNSQIALEWSLRTQGGRDVCQTVPTESKDASWGPPRLWVPAEMRRSLRREQKQEESEEFDFGELPDATADELGEYWGKCSPKWTWAHNGLHPNGWVNLHSDGVLSSKWGIGTWQLLQGPVLLITFTGTEHACRLCGAGTPSPYFDIVAKRRLGSEPSLADPCNDSIVEEVLRPGAPNCGPTRGFPYTGPTPASATASGGA